MALPAAINKRTVVWTLQVDGSPAVGVLVSFTPGEKVVSVPGTSTTTIAPVTATTGSDGSISVSLACTDDTDTVPMLKGWQVTTTIDNQTITGWFDVPVTGSGSINLASITLRKSK